MKVVEVLVAQLYLTFCKPMDCSLPGSSIRGNCPGINSLKLLFWLHPTNSDTLYFYYHLVWHSLQFLLKYIGIPINFHEESGIVTFWSNELSAPLDVSKGCEALCPDSWRTMAFSRVSTGDSVTLHLVGWNMSLHLSHCSEPGPSFESGHLRVHSTWGRKHRVPLT